MKIIRVKRYVIDNSFFLLKEKIVTRRIVSVFSLKTRKALLAWFSFTATEISKIITRCTDFCEEILLPDHINLTRLN